MLGYLPKLTCYTKKETDAFQDANRELRFGCISALLAPLREVHDIGGFFLLVNGKIRCFLPVIAIIQQDNKEGDYQCGIKSSNRTYFGCRICWTPSLSFANPWAAAIRKFRTGDSTKRYVTPLLEVMKYPPDPRKRKRDDELTPRGARDKIGEASLQAVYNPWWDAPFGANHMGVHGATPPDVLHQWQLGIMKYTWEYIWEYIKDKDVHGKGRSSAKSAFNSRFADINTRHHDPMLPRKAFPKGRDGLLRVEGKDYRALMFHSIVVISNSGVIIPIQEAEKLVSLIWKTVDLHDRWTDPEGHSEHDVQRLQAETNLFMLEFKEMFGKYNTSDCAFLKMHLCTHLGDTVVAWGSLKAVDTRAGEATNADMKQAYRSTDRKHETLEGQLFVQSRMKQALTVANRPVLNSEGRGGIDRLTSRGWSIYDETKGKISTEECGVLFPFPHAITDDHVTRVVNEWFASSGYTQADRITGVTWHKGFRLTAQNSREPLTFHAWHDIDRRPWYDNVKVLYAGETGSSSYFAAARCVAFLNIKILVGTLRVEMKHEMVAVIWPYKAWQPPSFKKRHRGVADVFDLSDKRFYSHGFKSVPFPIIVPSLTTLSGKIVPAIEIVNTETISSSLWITRCLDGPQNTAGASWIVVNPLSKTTVPPQP